MLLMIYSLRLFFQYFLYFLGYYLIYLNNFQKKNIKIGIQNLLINMKNIKFLIKKIKKFLLTFTASRLYNFIIKKNVLR